MREYVDAGHPVSLYIHVPFCTTRCGYCAFYSLPASKCGRELRDRYYDTLMRQLEELAGELGRPFHTVYVGGGNPGLLGARRLRSILSLACDAGKPEEVSVEINPETLDESFDSLCGIVTRFSAGIQSFSPHSLSILQRNADVKAVERALDLLCDFRRVSGISFNADLMMNIPHTSVSSTIDDINRLVSYRPEHVSLYSLTFEEGTRLVETEQPLDEDEEADNLIRCWDELGRLGYEHYEVSAFARDGHYCRHNLVYWNLGQYIGLGPSAESSVGWSRVVSSREAETLEGYLDRPSFDSEMLTVEQTVEEYVMTRLRTKWGIDRQSFLERFGTSFDSLFSQAVSRLDPSWYDDDGQFFALKRDGVMVMNRILLSLLAGL